MFWKYTIWEYTNMSCTKEISSILFCQENGSTLCQTWKDKFNDLSLWHPFAIRLPSILIFLSLLQNLFAAKKKSSYLRIIFPLNRFVLFCYPFAIHLVSVRYQASILLRFHPSVFLLPSVLAVIKIVSTKWKEAPDTYAVPFDRLIFISLNNCDWCIVIMFLSGFLRAIYSKEKRHLSLQHW